MNDNDTGTRRYLRTKDGGRADITNCFWCGNARTHICQSCAAKPASLFWTEDHGSSDAAFNAARDAAAKQFAARIIGPSWRIEATPEGWRIVP